MLLSLQGVQQLLHQIVDEEQLQLHGGIVDGDGQLMGDVVAEGAYGGVVVGSDPLPRQIGEAVNQHPSAGLFTIMEEQLLPRPLGASVGGVPEAAR